VVIRDDGSPSARDFRSKLYHIYTADVEGAKISDDLNQKVDETIPLPDLVKNAYILLGKDWKTVYDSWKNKIPFVPPVMITVANTTYTSARIKYSFDHDSFWLSAVGLGELCNSEKTLQIDTGILNKVEKGEFGEFNGDETKQDVEEAEDVLEEENDEPKEKKKTKKELALELREKVNTVGRFGEAGEQIQNVISVGMLSEGWDAKTVSHIMGLRAFSSQLLCEQVVGRGLRRTEYDVNKETGLFEPEYVNIFGVPFTFLPHEETGEGPQPPPPKAKTEIKPVKEKAEHEISFPNVLRIDHIYKPQLTINLATVIPLELDPYSSITEAELGAIIAGKPTNLSISEIDLVEIGINTRMQTIIFKTASAIYNSEKKPDWKGSKETFLILLIGIVEKIINSDKIRFRNPLFNQDEGRKRILLMLNMNKVIQHIWNEIRAVNTTQLTPIFDKEHPIRSTTDIRTWWTSKPCENFSKSHINFVVCDSSWEFLEARKINDSDVVESFVKNDHLGFAIIYNYQGIVNRYFPDFIIKQKTGEHLILETKGQDKDKDKTKRAFLDEWCRAVNQHGGFGKWSWAVSFDANDLDSILQKSSEVVTSNCISQHTKPLTEGNV
ncbi:MAG: type III restriction endonuclease subunit R, partial [Bacteroidetes bacterium]|nr:type III restriction endonuclease subunit R [Bacteroidota bacterium]